MVAEDDDTSWSTLLEALLRGASHALSNRVAALSAVSELRAIGDEEAQALLPHEIAELHELNRRLRLLASDENALPEALELESVLQDAAAVMALHPLAREIPWKVRKTGTPGPVRVERWVCVRLFVMLAASMLGRVAGHDHPEMAFEVSGDAQSTTVTLHSSASSHVLQPPGRESRELVARLGGTIHTTDDRVVVQLISLAALRDSAHGRGHINT